MNVKKVDELGPLSACLLPLLHHINKNEEIFYVGLDLLVLNVQCYRTGWSQIGHTSKKQILR
jgi:hypothetical protein